MGGVSRGLFYLIDPPGVVRNVLLVLRVDSLHLPVSGGLGEERTEEELGEPVQGPTEMVGAHVKIVVGVVAAREGVETPAVLTEELAVLVLIWEFLCP